MPVPSAANKSGYPLFDMYPLEELSLKLGLSELYLAERKTGVRPFGPNSQKRISTILGMPVETLFGPGKEVQDA